MASKPLPPTDLLRQLLEYDKESGQLTWRPRGTEFFDGNVGRCRVWNSRYAGTIAGSGKGYLRIKVMWGGYMAHRVIWKMETGEEPDEIDHINRDKQDNRWSNLRNVDHAKNMRNKPVYANNTSGHKHVYWMAKLQRWAVQLTVPGKGQRQVAFRRTLDEAVAARNQIMSEYGYDLETDAA